MEWIYGIMAEPKCIWATPPHQMHTHAIQTSHYSLNAHTTKLKSTHNCLRGKPIDNDFSMISPFACDANRTNPWSKLNIASPPRIGDGVSGLTMPAATWSNSLQPNWASSLRGQGHSMTGSKRLFLADPSIKRVLSYMGFWHIWEAGALEEFYSCDFVGVLSGWMWVDVGDVSWGSYRVIEWGLWCTSYDATMVVNLRARWHRRGGERGGGGGTTSSDTMMVVNIPMGGEWGGGGTASSDTHDGS